MPDQLGRQRRRRGLGQRPTVQRNLACRVARLGAQMLAMQHEQLLSRDEPQPQERRHRRILQILRVPRRRLQKSLLDHVRGIDSPLQPAVHA